MSKNNFSNLEKTENKIKSLEIQGASKIERSVEEAIIKDLTKNKSGDLKDLKKGLVKTLGKIWMLRPTEPALRSFIYYLYVLIMQDSSKDSESFVKKVIKFTKRDLQESEKGKKIIAESFVDMFDKEVVVFTHCHSHTVEYCIEKLADVGLLDYVINTETRPAFQGRITAKNLVEKGIKVKHVVDSGAYQMMDKADVFISGCDSILSNGSIINKIGTTQISMIAEKFNVPHYVLTHMDKFDPLSLYGSEPNLDKRNPAEVWDYKNKNLEIINNAFDLVPSYLIQQIITDKGNFDPYGIGNYYLKQVDVHKFKEVFDMFSKGC